jgi:hypothetical protein
MKPYLILLFKFLITGFKEREKGSDIGRWHLALKFLGLTPYFN